MKTFRQLRETSAKVAVISFGRFNPPTIGHTKLVDKVVSVASRIGGNAYVFTSRTHDSKKNPLPYDYKINLMKRVFPSREYNLFKYEKSKHKTVLHSASSLFDDGYDELVLIVGSDRVKDFKGLLLQYNGVKGKGHGFYEFAKITVESAGERDPDVVGASGMSASRLRSYAVSGDFESFEAGIPDTINADDKRQVFQQLRKNMRLSVIESIRHRDVDKDCEVETESKSIECGQIIEYLYNLPLMGGEVVYVDNVSVLLESLTNNTSYVDARDCVCKIKSIINTLDEHSGMIDFEVLDLNVLDEYVKKIDRHEYKLVSLVEKLKQRVKTSSDDEADVVIKPSLKSTDIEKDGEVKKKEDKQKALQKAVDKLDGDDDEDDEDDADDADDGASSKSKDNKKAKESNYI